MSKKHHYRRRDRNPPELDVTTFLNLMVVLVPFLLITAVFSRITIHELSMPAAAGDSRTNSKVSIEIIVRKSSLEVGDGRRTIARFRNKENNQYDLDKLSNYLLKLKGSYPDKTDATILMEPNIEYDYLVQIMDTVRVARVTKESQEEPEKIALFPDISIGDAP